MERYHDQMLHKALVVIFRQLQRYFTACQKERNFLTAAEDAISRIMLPRIENLIIEDIMNGGEHEYKYVENSKARQSILMVDKVPYCNYQATKGTHLLQVYDCPLEGRFDLIEEGKKTLQMVQDFRSMSVSDFQKKYYQPPAYKEINRLLGLLESLCTVDVYHNAVLNNKRMKGEFRFDQRAKIAVMPFLNANSRGAARYEATTLYYRDMIIDRVCANVTLERGKTTEDFVLTAFELLLHTAGDAGECFSLPFVFKPEHRGSCESFGRMFTKKIYPQYEHEATDRITISMDMSGCIRTKECGTADRRSIKKMLTDYEALRQRAEAICATLITPADFRRLSDENTILLTRYLEYKDFFKEVRDALDFVKSSTMARLTDDMTFRIGSLLASTEAYAHAMVLLSGGFDKRLEQALEATRKTAFSSEWMSYEEYESTVRTPLECDAIKQVIQKELQGGDVAEQKTIADMHVVIREIKELRKRYHIKEENIIDSTLSVFFAEDDAGRTQTLYTEGLQSPQQQPVREKTPMEKYTDSVNEYFDRCKDQVRDASGKLVNNAYAVYEKTEQTEVTRIRNHTDRTEVLLLYSAKGRAAWALNYALNPDFAPRQPGESYAKAYLRSMEDVEKFVTLPEVRRLVARFIGADQKKE